MLGILIAVTNKHKCSIRNMDMERSFLDQLWINKIAISRASEFGPEIRSLDNPDTTEYLIVNSPTHL